MTGTRSVTRNLAKSVKGAVTSEGKFRVLHRKLERQGRDERTVDRQKLYGIEI